MRKKRKQLPKVVEYNTNAMNGAHHNDDPRGLNMEGSLGEGLLDSVDPHGSEGPRPTSYESAQRFASNVWGAVPSRADIANRFTTPQLCKSRDVESAQAPAPLQGYLVSTVPENDTRCEKVKRELYTRWAQVSCRGIAQDLFVKNADGSYTSLRADDPRAIRAAYREQDCYVQNADGSYSYAVMSRSAFQKIPKTRGNRCEYLDYALLHGSAEYLRHASGDTEKQAMTALGEESVTADLAAATSFTKGARRAAFVTAAALACMGGESYLGTKPAWWKNVIGGVSTGVALAATAVRTTYGRDIAHLGMLPQAASFVARTVIAEQVVEGFTNPFGIDSSGLGAAATFAFAATAGTFERTWGFATQGVDLSQLPPFFLRAVMIPPAVSVTNGMISEVNRRRLTEDPCSVVMNGKFYANATGATELAQLQAVGTKNGVAQSPQSIEDGLVTVCEFCTQMVLQLRSNPESKTNELPVNGAEGYNEIICDITNMEKLFVVANTLAPTPAPTSAPTSAPTFFPTFEGQTRKPTNIPTWTPDPDANDDGDDNDAGMETAGRTAVAKPYDGAIKAAKDTFETAKSMILNMKF